jgi:uracil DNA glycosylase
MLNAVLTVRAHAAASHAKQGCAAMRYPVWDALLSQGQGCHLHLRAL